MTKTKKKKRNIWTDGADYGTYDGERGNPEQWRQSFSFAWDRSEWSSGKAAGVLKGKSPNAVLGVKMGASIDEIKTAFRKLIKIYHPDKPGGDRDKAEEVMAAYFTLTDED